MSRPSCDAATGSTGDGELDAGKSCDCDIEADGCGPVPCETVFLVCGRACGVSEPGPLQCVLAALRDREPGLVTWIFNDALAPSYVVTSARVFPDGSAWLFRRTADACQPEGFNSSGPDA